MRLPVRVQLPRERLVDEVLRDGDLEDVLVAARHEVRRLPAIAARLERVVGPDRDVDFLFVVAVHVAEPHVEGAVGIDVEPFVHRRDGLARPMAKVDELRGALRPERDGHREGSE